MSSVVVGMDEVGRGSWAGPLFVGAVILGKPIPGLRDSKLLTRQQREKLDPLIRDQAEAFALGVVSHSEIDELGLTAATRIAYERAIAGITVEYDEIIIDGSYSYLATNDKARTIIGADRSVAAVSAASIIAKVARDELMRSLSRDYPAYGFDRHVGYGTAFHASALRTYGLCDIHRRSFKPVRSALKAGA